MLYAANMLTGTVADSLRGPLIVLVVILAVLVLSSIVFTLLFARKNKGSKILLGVLYAVTLIVLVCALLCFFKFNSIRNDEADLDETKSQDGTSTEADSTGDPSTSVEDPTAPTPPTQGETVADPSVSPGFVESSDPKNWGIKWEVIQNGSIVDSYTRQDPITFGHGSKYTKLEGIVTFRGDNYRSGATYGTANIVNETIAEHWRTGIGSLNGWPGSGWTGQPLIVRWDNETKKIMNLYEDKKAKEGLVEVIYATLDGYIYFYDLDDGSYTRDKLWVGMNFKGAGSLDPRGYPLMYVGSGDSYNGKKPRMYIISLIDGEITEMSGSDSFSKRTDWTAFDSSPLVDAETDTLIWPGENGILYTIKLNTQYDPAAGTISVNPEQVVKNRYTTNRSSGSKYWLGYEPSCVIVDRYLYISENGGMFFCIDLNTMQLVWAQDTKDDSNSTPVFQWDESTKTGYIYTAPSLHWTADGSREGNLSIYKLNATTGEIVWEYKYDCITVPDVSGGIQSSPLLGKEGTDLEGLILYSIARTPNSWNGKLVALDTETGNVVWEMDMDNYTWSSPVAVYTESGKSYVVICDSAGNVSLLEGSTGTVKSTMNVGSNVEASPAVFENMVVVGTRGGRIYGMKVS